MEEEHIYIILSKTRTWISRSIGHITKSSYTHVSLSFDNKFDNMYSFARKNPSNPFNAGLTIENINNVVYSNPYCTCLIYKIPVTTEQLELLKNELDIYLSSANLYKYNFLGLFAVLFNKPLKRKNYYFCSQFISTLLSKSTIWYSPKCPELTKPSDLVQIPNAIVYYQGYINDLNFDADLNISIL